MKTKFILLLMLILTGCHAGAKLEQAGSKLDGVMPCDANLIGRKLVDNLLERRYMLYDSRRGIHYAECCAAVGALRYAEVTGNKELGEKIIDRYKGFLDPNSILIDQVRHVDHSVMGIVPLQIYLYNGDKRFLEAGLTFADKQWDNPLDSGLTRETRWWIDDMYMVGMLQIQAYRATKQIKYADHAANQLAAYLEKLQQPNGLFYHGPKFHYHWGRGNGWVAASMAEVLQSLPADHKLRSEIMAGYKNMMSSLLKYQSDNGMWRQLVDYEYAWAESSCTAMFAYAMSVGVKNGWLDKNKYGPAVEKAWKALCAHVDRNGNLREICIGTGQQDDIEFYLNRPRTLGDLHGQAPVLWLVKEMLAK